MNKLFEVGKNMDEAILSQTLDDRLQAWILFSYKLFGLKKAPHFIANIQMCGRIDLKICKMELELKVNDNCHLFASADVVDLSKLWVCFFYETLRAYKSFVKEFKIEDYWFRETFEKLKILRMPMAKLQVEGVDNYQKGYHVETTTFFPTVPSVGWIVHSRKDGEQHLIRQLLANEFLTAGKEKLKQPQESTQIVF